MKKVLLLVIMFLCTLSFTAHTQTKLSILFGKIKSAPINQYGVQRIDYGTWDTTAHGINTWAYFSKKEGFILCQSEGKHVGCFCMEPKPNQEIAEKILKEMDPTKWKPSVW